MSDISVSATKHIDSFDRLGVILREARARKFYSILDIFDRLTHFYSQISIQSFKEM